MGGGFSINRHVVAGKWKILVTPEEACQSLARIPKSLLSRCEMTPTGGRIDDEQRLAELLGRHDAVMLDIERITSDLLQRCPRLRVISRFGVGYDRIDLDAARQHQVRVTTTAGVATRAVARHALSLMLALAHRVVENDANLKAGRWQRQPNEPVEALTLGVAGFGRIGEATARMASAIGFRVLVWSPHRRRTPYAWARSLRALLQRADVVSLHLKLTPETQRIIGAPELEALRGKLLINTARGGLVDESAVLHALQSGALRGYATDVLCHEPPTDVSQALVQHPRVIASPHVAAMDRHTAQHMTERALENIVHSLRGVHDKVDAYVV